MNKIISNNYINFIAFSSSIKYKCICYKRQMKPFFNTLTAMYTE